MATIANLNVLLTLTDKMSGELDKVKKKTSDWGADLRRVGTMATLGITTPFVLGVGKMIMSASDLNEAISATKAVFGESADGIIDWSESTAKALGISQQDALTSAVTFAGLGKTAGYVGDDLNDFSTDLIQAASDLGSFYNVDPGTVLEDLRSGLAGESEPLRKYGIFLNEAAVAQKAMEMTGKANAKQLTEGDKIAARSALIMENLGDASGDFARTSKGLANQMRILRARFRDVSAHLGQIFLPYAQQLVELFGKLLDWFDKLSPRMQKFGIIIGIVAAAIGPLLIMLGLMLPAIVALTGPIGLIILALTALGTAYATNLFGFRDAINSVVGTLVEFGKAVYDAFSSGEGVEAILDRVFGEDSTGKLRDFVGGILRVADAVGDLVAAFRSGGLSGALAVFREELGNITSELRNLAAIAVDLVIDTAVSIVGWLWDNRSDIWGGIKSAVGWTIDTFEQAISVIVDGTLSLGETLLGYSLAFGTWLWHQLKANWDGILSIGTALVDGLLDLGAQMTIYALNFGTWLKNQLIGNWDKIVDIGTALVDGLLDLGTQMALYALNMSQWLKGKLTENWDKIVDIGTVTIDAVIELSDDIDWDGFGSAVRDAAVAAVEALASLGSDIGDAINEKIGAVNWNEVITKDSFNVAVPIGAALRWQIATAANITRDVGEALHDLDWSSVPQKLADGITTALKAIGGLYLGLSTAIASFIGGAVAGIVFGGDVKWDTVITKINDALRGVITVESFATVGEAIATALWGAIENGLRAAIPGPLEDLIFGKIETGPAGGKGFGKKALTPSGLSPDDLRKLTDNTAMAAAAIATSLNTMASSAARAFTQMQTASQRSVQTMTQSITRDVQTMRSSVGSTLSAMASDVASRFAQSTQAGVSQVNALRSGVTAAASAIGAAGRTAGESFRSGIASGFAAAASAAAAGAAQIRAAASIGSLYSQGFSVGSSLGQGLAAGMQSWASAIAATAANLVNQAISAARQAAAAQSPSRKMMALGDDLIAGLLIPLEAGARLTNAAFTDLINPPAYSVSTGVSGISGGFTGGPVVNVTLEAGAVVNGEPMDAEQLGDAIGNQISRALRLQTGVAW